jgi:hypothetical protein
MSARIVLATLFFAVLLSSCSSPSDVRPGQCHPCTVSKEVGPLLKEAQTLIAAQNYEGAMAKMNEAEAVKSNPDDTTVINAMRKYIEYASSPPPGGPSSTLDARIKFANDYNAGKWRDVIADADMLKKAGALDAQAQLVIGQAYFKAGDYAGCVRYAKTLNSNEAHELQTRCAYEVAKAPQP